MDQTKREKPPGKRTKASKERRSSEYDSSSGTKDDTEGEHDEGGEDERRLDGRKDRQQSIDESVRRSRQPSAVSVSEGTNRSQPTHSRLPFPLKLHRILEEAEQNNLTHIIGWTHNGEGFMVRNKHAFEAKFIPRYFSTTTYRGYHRNLNLWGFKTVNRGGDRGTCWHPYFKKGRPELCRFMERLALKGNQPSQGMNEDLQTAEKQHQNASPAIATMSSASAKKYTQALSQERSLVVEQANNLLEKKPAARQAGAGGQNPHQGSVTQLPPNLLQNLQIFHPNQAVWNQNLSALMSSSQGASSMEGQMRLHQQPQQQPANLFQHFLASSSSNNVPTQPSGDSPTHLAGNTMGRAPESQLLQRLQSQLGIFQAEPTATPNTNEQLAQQLLLQLLRQNDAAVPLQGLSPQVASLTPNASITDIDLTSRIQLALQAQQRGQQQQQATAVQQLLQTLQAQQEQQQQPPGRYYS
jgi:HSF-type DNA-binding